MLNLCRAGGLLLAVGGLGLLGPSLRAQTPSPVSAPTAAPLKGAALPQAKCPWVWSAPVGLSRPGAQVNLSPQVAVDAAGGAMAAWTEIDPDRTEHILVSRRPPGGDWLPPEEVAQTLPSTLSDEFTSELDLAVGPAGHALLTWRRSHVQKPSRPFVAAWHPSRGWTEPMDLKIPGIRNMQAARVAINEHGQGVVAWMSQEQVYMHLLDPASGLSPLRSVPLTANGWSDPQPRVAINSAGQAAVVWDSLLPTVTRHDPLTGWSEPEALMRKGRVDFRRSPELALGPSGDLFVTWSHLPSNQEKLQIHVAHFRPGQGWDPVRVLSNPDNQAVEPDVAVDAKGQAVVAWVLAKPAGQGRLQAARFAPSTGWTGVDRITPDRDPDNLFVAPRVHLSHAGRVTVSSYWWPGGLESHTSLVGRQTQVRTTLHSGLGSNNDVAGAANGPMAVNGVVWGKGPYGARGDQLNVRVLERRCDAPQAAVTPW